MNVGNHDFDQKCKTQKIILLLKLEEATSKTK
jgi:hypothetical protein